MTLLLTILLQACTTSPPAITPGSTGIVVAVNDGISLDVRTESGERYTIVLHGISAPAAKHPIAQVSQQRLAQMSLNKVVRIDTPHPAGDGTWSANLWVQPADCSRCGQTLNLNHVQVLAGLARWQPEAPHQSAEERGRLESAELEAKARGWGLWAPAAAEGAASGRAHNLN